MINWALAPSPDRYRNTDVTNRESADRFYKEDHQWEDAQADKVHRFLASKEGQEAIRQYA